MEFYEIQALSSLKPGYMSIPEPAENVRFENKSLNNGALMIMPGAAFDIFRNRIGYGKGFYDRYLAGININTIAICYDCQVYTDKLPADTNDKKPMLIITESRLIS